MSFQPTIITEQNMLSIATDYAASTIDAHALLDTIDAFHAEHTANKSQSTKENYAYQMKPFVAWWNDYGPRNNYILSPAALSDFTRWMREDYVTGRGGKAAASTRHTTAKRVRQYFKWLHQTGRLPVDVSDWVDLPAPVIKPQRYHEIEALQAFADGIPTGAHWLRDTACYLFLLGTGARRFEVANALYDSVSFVDGGGSCHLHRVKNDADGDGAGRHVVFGPGTAAVLREWLHFRRYYGTDDTRLFTMSDQAIKMRMRLIAQEAGMAASPHDFRRTFADWWYDHHENNERALTLLKLQLGHSISGDTTLNHYINLRNPARLTERILANYVSPVESLNLRFPI